MRRDLRGLRLISYVKSKQILLFGSVPLFLGLLALAGWIFSRPNLASIIPHTQHMVISTALSFTLAGASLIFLYFHSNHTLKITRLAGCILVIVGSIVLIESYLDYSWIDFNHLHSSSSADAPLHAGRMAPNTAICFILLGGLFVLTSAYQHTALTMIYQSVYLILILMSLLGIASYVVNLEFIYSFYENNRMSLPTAIAMFFAGLGIATVRQRIRLLNDKSSIEANSIYSASSLMMFTIVLTVAVFSFALSQNRVEQTMKEQMTEISIDRRSYFASMIKMKTDIAKVNADRPLFIQNLLQNDKLSDSANKGIITEMMGNYLREGFSGLALEDHNGKVITEVGEFTKKPDLRLPINHPFFSELLWKNGYILLNRIPMHNSEGTTIAYMRSEQLLTELTQFHQNALHRGETSDMVVCGLKNGYQNCFPFRWSPQPKILYGYLDGKPLPLTRAVKGEVDTSVTRDYRRQRVMAAIGPIGTTGLGMATKIDMREQYAPIRQQFISAIPFFLLLILMSIILMWFKLNPIVNALNASKIKLSHLANHDPLTTLPNRLLFNDRLETAILRANRASGFLALMYVDVDHFKNINDSFGHKAGDELLQWFALQLKDAVRETDTVARLGGDEFSIILESLSNIQDAQRLAESIIESISSKTPPLQNNQIPKITSSIGVAIYRENMVAQDLLNQADVALYKAKQAGRNTYRFNDLS
ncbi:MAG: GGDEF domain-containing protein [Legionella sp.]|nr:GGDEF domain-containing protein [Legionella sp.]